MQKEKILERKERLSQDTEEKRNWKRNMNSGAMRDAINTQNSVHKENKLLFTEADY